MQITVPYGFDDIVPLKKHHKVLMPAGTTPAFCRKLNAIAVSFSEFTAAAHDYPIVFAGTEGNRNFAPIIVLGLADGVNLFVNAAGDWDPSVYQPAYMRRYPFCVSKAYVDGEPRGQSIVCVARAFLDDGGIALFDEHGNSTGRWQAVERLLAEYETDLDRTAQFTAALRQLNLLEPFSMQVVEDNRSSVRLAGMFRVDEAKLAALRPASHKALVTKGFMNRIYAHLLSLENFSRLYAREQALNAPKRPGRA
jgi:hypothetical protein